MTLKTDETTTPTPQAMTIAIASNILQDFHDYDPDTDISAALRVVLAALEQRAVLVEALQRAEREIAYMADGFTHADWRTKQAIESLQIVRAALQHAGVTK